MSQSNFFDVLSRPRVRLAFKGATYSDEFDHARLTGQIKRIWDVLQDGQWRTLQELGSVASAPPASVSAQLRNLRKVEFGSHCIERRSRGDRKHGLYEYRLNPNPTASNADAEGLPETPPQTAQLRSEAILAEIRRINRRLRVLNTRLETEGGES